MHYILLAIALNLGKENLELISLNDLKKTSQIAKTNTKINANKNKEENIKMEEVIILPDSNIKNDELLFDNTKVIDEPYIQSDNFAVLLSEDEQGNVIQTPNEEEGPKFLDNIKNKLIETTEKNSKKTVVGSQIEGPSFFDNIKNKIMNREKEKNAIIISEDIGPEIFKEIKAEKKAEIVETKKVIEKKNTIIDKIKDKTSKASEKIKDISKVNFVDSLKKKIIESDDTPEEKIEQLRIVGTLFESEVNQALKTEATIESKELEKNKIFDSKREVSYEEDENYNKYLQEKEINVLAQPEKIIIPNIKPRQKEISTYKTQEVPEELLEARSFQNRHIPKILQKKDEEELLSKTIEYGMLPEFKAFMNNFRDANLILSNQYTLLTYAVKNRQYDIVKYLLHIGADINKRDDRLDTPLVIAVRNNDLQAVKILTNSNANPNMVDILKRTPLIYAIEKNYTPIAIYLIDNGADVNIPNGVGEGTLAMSIRLGRNVVKEKIINVLKNEK